LTKLLKEHNIYVICITPIHSIHFFIRTILSEHGAHFCSKFKNKLRTNPSLGRRTKFQIFN